MPFLIIRNDITKVAADAIVNSANPEPVFGSGTDRAVYQAAGAENLLAERKKIGRMKFGEVSATRAFDLPAKYIIHAAGPKWVDGNAGEMEDLASCYRKSLFLAKRLRCKSIAFPLISTGNYGFPKDQALSVALREFREFLDTTEMEIILVVADKNSFELSSQLASSVRQFIDDHQWQRMFEEEYPYSGYHDKDVPQAFAPETDSFIEDDASDHSVFPESPSMSFGRPAGSPAGRPQGVFFNRIREGIEDTEESAGEPREKSAGRKADGIPGRKESRPAGAQKGEEQRSTAGSLKWMEERNAEGSPKWKRERSAASSPKWKEERSAAGSPKWVEERSAGSFPKLSKERSAARSAGPALGSSFRRRRLQDLLDNAGETFQEMLLRLIAEKQMSFPDVYKRANLDKKLFSKIRHNKSYTPKKQTAVALAIALRLTLDETADLIGRAGLALSPSSTFDLIIEYCIEQRIYDVFEINALLFEYDQQLLGY